MKPGIGTGCQPLDDGWGSAAQKFTGNLQSEVYVVERKRDRGSRELLKGVPGWERFGWVTAGFSARLGGVSRLFAGVEGEGLLNLGFVPQDEPTAVRENRDRLSRLIAGAPWRLVVSKQVHGVEIREVTAGNVDEAMLTGQGQWEADGLVTREAGVLLGVGAADCVPVLVADVRQRVVGAFHAGWRGTAAQMAKFGVLRMMEAFGTKPVDCVAAIGPSIGSCCYEVGDEVREGFRDQPVIRAGEQAGKWRLDLWEANRRQLTEAGVPDAAVTVLGECTGCSRDAAGRRLYFSHRAEGGVTGRMLGVIGVRQG